MLILGGSTQLLSTAVQGDGSCVFGTMRLLLLCNSLTLRASPLSLLVLHKRENWGLEEGWEHDPSWG